MAPLRRVAAVVFLSGCAATQPPTPPSGNAQELLFGWEPELRAEVALTKTITRLDDPALTRSARASVWMRAEPYGELVLIHVEADRPALVGTPLSDFVVTPGGEFVGIADVQGLHARVDALIEDTTPDPDLEFELRELLVSEALLESRLEELWNAVVGTWAGLRLEPGERLEDLEVELPAAVLPDHSYGVRFDLRSLRTSRCMRGGSDRTCVDLELRLEPDEADARRLIGVVLRRAAPAGVRPESVPVPDRVEVATVLRLRTEPQGLVPHEMTMTKRVRLTFAQAERPIEQIETLGAVYRYAD
jgi:hypothetical protein